MTAYCDDYVLVRCPKTGSTYASVVVRQLGCAPGRLRAAEPHEPVWAIPQEWTAARKTIGTVRNPWDWYRSFWAHLTREGCWDDLEAYGGRGFRPFLYGATHGQGPDRLCGVVYLPHANGHHWRESGLGLATWLHLHFYGERFPKALTPWAVDLMIPTEHLTDALSEVLHGNAAQWPPRNVGDYAPPEYDSEMLEWVEAADARLISDFGWHFGGPSEQKIHRR